jgi:membrane protease YdiL (CAAX protease family)
MEQEWTDQELQGLFEQDPQAFAELARANEDARLYALLFTTFSSLDTVTSSVEVSDLVLTTLENKKAKSKNWQSIGWAIGIFFAIIGSIILSFLFVPQLVSSMKNTYLYVPLLLVGTLLFSIVEYLDQKIIWEKLDNQLFE